MKKILLALIVVAFGFVGKNGEFQYKYKMLFLK